ncbi:MAG: hypothetical protein ABFD81_14495 [Syntrophaceae bacterium]
MAYAWRDSSGGKNDHWVYGDTSRTLAYCVRDKSGIWSWVTCEGREGTAGNLGAAQVAAEKALRRK